VSGVSGVDDFHAEVAAIALRAAGPGFVLAGGNALRAHGIGRRPTMDVNLATSLEDGVRHAMDAVAAALKEAGFHVERIDPFAEDDPEQPDFIGEMAGGWVEWTVARRGGKQVVLQMSLTGGARTPVQMALGPVMALEDVLGAKLLASLERGEVRDLIDLGDALRQFSPYQLMEWARILEPGLTIEDFTAVAAQLDTLEDKAFARYGLDEAAIRSLRERFAVWPRQGSDN
jgi:hypothetical protein